MRNVLGGDEKNVNFPGELGVDFYGWILFSDSVACEIGHGQGFLTFLFFMVIVN
jgi:hypothetical protein